MLKTGLVSITFRNLNVEEIIGLVKRAGLDGIEWGGYVHVPHGDLKKAQKVKEMTEDAGIEVASYGSYYRVGCDNSGIGPFERVLETATVLDVPTIRVWAGNKGSADAGEKLWEKVVEESKEISDLAQQEGISISYEYHGNTLTDSSESACRLLKAVSHDNIKSYWQPPHYKTVDERLQTLRDILPWISNVHVFYWVSMERYPLSEAVSDWVKYLKELDNLVGCHYALLEFVKDDCPEQFLEDSKALKEIVKMVQ